MATQGYPQEYAQLNYQSHHHHQSNSQASNSQHYDPYAMVDNYHYQGYHGYHGSSSYGYGGVGYYDPSIYQQYYSSYYHGYEVAASNENSFLPSDCTDCIFISGLPQTITKKDLIASFSTIGKIKVAKGTQRVFLFLDRKTKEPTGDATVTFQSAESAQKAIEMFHESDFNGHGTINVKIATPEQKNPFAEMLRRQSEANAYASSYGSYNMRAYQGKGHHHMMYSGGSSYGGNRRYVPRNRHQHHRSRPVHGRGQNRTTRQNSTEKGDSLSSGGSSSPISLEHQKSDEANSIPDDKETEELTARTSELTIQQ